jgi:anti-sigma factor RsiW
MKTDCTNWKDQLLEAALTEDAPASLEQHLRHCPGCAAELAALRAKRAQLDELLPILTQAGEPPADLHARVLTAASEFSRASRIKPARSWRALTAMAALTAALIVALAFYQRSPRTMPDSDLETAQKLAEWRAPSDVLLQNPGREILNSTPRLGDSYFRVPAKNPSGEMK